MFVILNVAPKERSEESDHIRKSGLFIPIKPELRMTTKSNVILNEAPKEHSEGSRTIAIGFINAKIHTFNFSSLSLSVKFTPPL